MKKVGIATTVVAVAVVATGVVVGVRSIPDLKRYVKITRM